MGDPLTWYEALLNKTTTTACCLLKLEDVAILCSSPVRAQSIDATTKRVEARPFKGTAARHDDAKRSTSN